MSSMAALGSMRLGIQAWPARRRRRRPCLGFLSPSLDSVAASRGLWSMYRMRVGWWLLFWAAAPGHGGEDGDPGADRRSVGGRSGALPRLGRRGGSGLGSEIQHKDDPRSTCHRVYCFAACGGFLHRLTKPDGDGAASAPALEEVGGCRIPRAFYCFFVLAGCSLQFLLDACFLPVSLEVSACVLF